MNSIWQKIKHYNRQRNLKTKVFKINLRIFSLSLFKTKKTEFVPNRYESVLIFMHTNGLGDAIVLSGFIEILKRNDKSVHIIAEKRISFLFNDFIKVDNIIDYDKKNFKEIKNKIRNYQVDLVVDFSDMDGSIIERLKTLTLLKYKHAISFNQNKATLFDTNIIYNQNKHISDRMIYILSLLNITTSSYQYKLCISQQIEQDVDFFINHAVTNKNLVIFNPFASETARTMSLEQINRVMDFLETVNDYTTVVFDTKDIIDFSNYKNVIPNKLNSFIHAAELVKRADLIITVDTSIVHLAQAFNKKLIAIYNNRLFNKRFINNIVWGPNYKLATQITTNEYLNTESGDPISNFDIETLIDHLKTKTLEYNS